MRTYRDKARVICHALKMEMLAGVDPNKTIDLKSRIKALPSPEKIASMGHSDLIELTKRVERLLFDIDRSKNARTVDFALRHQLDKGIPPRLPPVLAGNWLTIASQAEELDYLKHRHPDWNVSKTPAKTGQSRVFRLNFGKAPILDFTLTRRDDGKYDGGINVTKEYPMGGIPRGVRSPVVAEIFSMTSDLIGHSLDFDNMQPDEFHRIMREGLPMPPEE